MGPAKYFSIIQLSNSRARHRVNSNELLRQNTFVCFKQLQFDHKSYIIPSLTVVKEKNRCIPHVYWSAAIFGLVTVFSNLLPSFTFFLNVFHFTFGYELIIGSKATDIMKGIRNRFPFVCWNKSLFFNLDKIHCFQSI